MNVKRIFVLTVVYFVVVTAAFVGVHLREMRVPEAQRAFAEILMLIEDHYVEPVDPSDVLFHSFEGLRKVVGEDSLSVERAGASVILRKAGGPARSLAVDGSRRELAEVFYDGVEFLETRFDGTLSEKEMEAEGIRQSIRWLDPHSAYLTAEEYRDLLGETQGHFGGVGIEITMTDEWLTVIAPIEGTPAFAAGILAGDQIREIDGESTEEMDLYTAVSRIRGEIGTKVVLGIYREGKDELLQIPVVRDEIRIEAIRWRLLDGDVGYVRVATFNETTTDELDEAFAEAQKGGRKPVGWILDLRQCPGGLLAQAISVTDLFIEEGRVVYTDGRDPSQHRDYFASRGPTRTDAPLVVLIGASSASAAEIVAGALADHRRALLVGSRTWGKASVQSIFSLPDGSALKLTTARYYTPNGISIQARGITPDVRVIYRLEDGTEYDPLGEKDLEGVLENHSTGPQREPAFAVEGEKIYETYKQRGLLDEDDFHAPDSLALFARDILLETAGASVEDMTAAAREVAAAIDLTELPPRPAPDAPALPPEEGSPERP